VTEPVHVHNWHRLSPQIQAAIAREIARTRPAEELDPEHCRHLAALLGLRRPDPDDDLVAGGDHDG
jgi:hypothetical protein